ncbi:MAG: hypothetical protein Q9181_002301 [Wetmoreana brouardii]
MKNFIQPSQDGEDRSAPWFNVPDVPLVSVEHPCLVSNTARAIETLGGARNMSKLTGETSASVEANLFLRPGDRFSRPVPSFNTKTSNLCLKVTVPKRTGRKRKRGSEGEWQKAVDIRSAKPRLLSEPQDARRLVRSLRDNIRTYRVQPLGSIGQTHRFRRLPDFVWSAEASPFVAKLREHILPLEYPKMKEFRFDWSTGVQATNDIIPPPSWTVHTIPFNYSYRQNPAVQQIFSSTGPPISRNTQLPRRNKIPMLSYNAPSVPTAPPEGIAPESTLPVASQTLLATIREIFLERPVCTRRVLQNKIPHAVWKAVGPNSAKYLWQYVGYLWSSGPWRDCMCALGVDPRQHKEMRKYQTLMFQLEPEAMDTKADKGKATKTRIDRELAAKGKNREGHLFDGRTVSLDGKLWQMCDVTDPLLKSLINTEALRDECHIFSDGWYANGVFAKIRILMKGKLELILRGNVDDEGRNQGFLVLSQMVPDVMTSENKEEARFGNRTASKWMMRMAEQMRNLATKPSSGSANGETTQNSSKEPSRGRESGSGVKVVIDSRRATKKHKGEKEDQQEDSNHTTDDQEMLDPRLRDTAAPLNRTERKAAMKAFEDVTGEEIVDDADIDEDNIEGSDLDDDESSEGSETEADVEEDGESEEDVEMEEDTGSDETE